MVLIFPMYFFLFSCYAGSFRISSDILSKCGRFWGLQDETKEQICSGLLPDCDNPYPGSFTNCVKHLASVIAGIDRA